MYAKVTDTTVDQFPYTFGELKRAFPNTSFPKTPPDSVLADYGVVHVTQEADPTYDEATQYLAQGVPVKAAGVWTVTRVIVALSAEEQVAAAKRIKNAAEREAIKSDAPVVALFTKSAAQIDTYIENNVTNLAEAKEVLKVLARASSVLAQRII